MPRMNISEERRKEYDAIVAGIGKRVRDARLAKGWSQEDLGRHIDKTDGWVSAIEIGRHGTNIMMLLEFARALDKPLVYFLGGDENRDVYVDNTHPPRDLMDWHALYPNDPKRAQSHSQLDSVFQGATVEVGRRRRALRESAV